MKSRLSAVRSDSIIHLDFSRSAPEDFRPGRALNVLIPDDDPELNLSPSVILPNENFMPMLPEGKDPVNPARSYLLSLNFARSWLTRASFLGIVAGMLGAASLSSAAGTACGAIT
ncbi:MULTISPECIES: hypothetical protein [Enterobacter]